MMGPEEALARLGHELALPLEARRAGRYPSMLPISAQRPADVELGSLNFTNRDPDLHRRQLISELSTLEEEAAAIKNGLLRIFDVDWPKGPETDWHQDPKTGRRAPQTYYRRIGHRFGDGVSAKHVWELNRHQHWLVLARAAYLLDDARSLDCLFAEWRSWIDSNPYLIGINWASPIELGLRMVTWAYVVEFVKDLGWPPGLFATVLRSVTAQSKHLLANRSYGSSANNHRLAEALGLFVAGCYFRCLPGAERWRSVGGADIRECADRLIGPDGVSRELATAYHGFTLDLFLIAGLVGRANSEDFGPAYWTTVEQMADYQFRIADGAGNLPAFGDDDDAHTFPALGSPNVSRFYSQMATCAVLFHRSDFRGVVESFDQRSYWLMGSAGAMSFASTRAEIPSRSSTAFRDAGVYVMRCWPPCGELVVVADAGPLGLKPLAAHGHADALSFVLSLAGTPIIVDPGTYTYHHEPTWRGYFKGTSAHNTVEIDGTNQSISGGPTMWTKHANAHLLEWSSGPSSDRLVAEHDGYRRRTNGIVHRRSWDLAKASGTLEVNDYLLGAGQHRVLVSFHLHPDCDVETINSRKIRVTLERFEIEIEIDGRLDVTLCRGSTSPPAGWYSRGFGRKEPCWTLRGGAVVVAPFAFRTFIRISGTTPKSPAAAGASL